VEDEVRREDPLGPLQPGEERRTVGCLERLPEVPDRLALQAGGVRKQRTVTVECLVSGSQVPSGSSRLSRPVSRSCRTSTAVKVLVIDPIMNWVSSSAGVAGSTRAAPTCCDQTS